MYAEVLFTFVFPENVVVKYAPSYFHLNITEWHPWV